MLVLVIQIGADRYALDVRQVREVVPAVAVRPVPHAPPEIAGLATWRGQVTPVIDLVRLLLGQPCPSRMSSRMVVVDYGREKRPLGLLAEQITDVERVDTKAVEEPGVTVPGATYLGRVLRINGVIVQLVEVKALLSDALRTLLWSAADEVRT